nr:MAG TPA: hypothetical protein [Caudoviricetes sp.]
MYHILPHYEVYIKTLNVHKNRLYIRQMIV